MATHKISRAELKKRLMIVVEAWPIELTQYRHTSGDSCILQIAINTDEWDVERLASMVAGKPFETLGMIDYIIWANDHGTRAELIEAIEAL